LGFLAKALRKELAEALAAGVAVASLWQADRVPEPAIGVTEVSLWQVGRVQEPAVGVASLQLAEWTSEPVSGR